MVPRAGEEEQGRNYGQYTHDTRTGKEIVARDGDGEGALIGRREGRCEV
jgi:hypothetical protein